MTTTAPSRPQPSAVVAKIAEDRPMFHLADRTSAQFSVGDEVNWNALPDTLSFIATNVRPGSKTLEIGSGATTVVFAACGADHMAISPVPHEHDRIADYCRGLGVPTDTVTFIADSSDAVVMDLDLDHPLDCVLLDGTHAFPYAIVEWHYLRRLLRPGGLMVIDDIPIPSVAPLYRFLDADADWELVAHLDGRTAAFRKLCETPVGQIWRDQRFNRGYPDLSFLPSGARVRASLRHRANKVRGALAHRFPALSRLRRFLQSRG